MEGQETFRWRGGFCMEVMPLPVRLVVFGANGDLAQRKLFPALYQLHRSGLLHERSRIIACARTAKDLTGLYPPDFTDRIDAISGDSFDPSVRAALKAHLETLKDACPLPSENVFYLSLPSDIYMDLLDVLSTDGILTETTRVVLEKPFGSDLASASAFDDRLHRILREEQIFRIDHYLGKETVQNLFFFRFANRLFEPLWNREHIESVRITVSETLGVEKRAKYFDRTGIVRDMVQNHMLELMSLVAMEKPRSFTADALHDEKTKLIRAIQPLKKENILCGQYAGYRKEPGVDPASGTETFFAARLAVENERWRGVPFDLSCGKKLAEKRTAIEVRFRRQEESIFPGIPADALVQNKLVFSIQPQEGLSLTIQAKHPGPKLCMGALDMNFNYASLSGENMPDAYERLLLDAMLDDRMLFIRSDSIRAAWELLDPVQAMKGEPVIYEAGSTGPAVPFFH